MASFDGYLDYQRREYCKDIKCPIQQLLDQEEEKSPNVFFKLTSSISPNPFSEMTSSVFYDVYDNQDWNFSVSIIPNKSGSLKFVNGATDYDYTLRFEGRNSVLGDIRDSFSVEQTLTKAKGEN